MAFSSFRRLPSPVRLRLEALEDRALPAVVTWTNPLGGNWSTPGNWSTRRLPAAGDDVVINLDGVTVSHNGGNDTIHSLTTSASASFVLGGGALTLLGHSTLNGPFTFDNAFLTQRGELDLEGSFTWTAGTVSGHGQTIANGIITLSTGAKSMVAQTLETAVAVTWTGGTLQLSSNATWNNLGTSTISILFDASLSGGTLDNAGVILKSAGAGTTTVNARLVNSGYLEVASGTLALGGGGVSSGSIVVDAGATLNFTNGTDTLTAASTLGGDGNVGFTGANVTLAGGYYITGTTTVSGGTANFSSDTYLGRLSVVGGTLTGEALVYASDLLTWTGGTLSGGGSTHAAGGLNINGSTGKTLTGRTLFNAGPAVWQGAGTISMLNGAIWDNLAGATLDIQTDAGFVGDFFEPTATFNNAGTLSKSAGTGTLNAKLFFDNSGLVDIASGTLSLNSEGFDSGSFVVESGAALKFLGGQGTQADSTFLHSATSSISGAGTVEFGTSGGGGNTTRNIVAGSYSVTGTTIVSGGELDFSNDVSLASLTVSGGILSGAGTVTVTGTMNWTGGTLTGSHLVSLGTLTLSGSGTKGLDSYTLDNFGSATWTGGDINSFSTTWNNLPGSSFDVQGTGQFTSGAFYSNSIFANAGTFTKSAGGNTKFRVFFDNSASVDVSAGTLEVSGGGTSSGTCTVEAGATLTFDGGTITLTPASGLSGDGNVGFADVGSAMFNDAGSFAVTGTTTVSAGTVNFDGGASLNNLALSGGTLGGAGDHVVGGLFTWTGGTLTGGGTTFANGGLTSSGSTGKILNDHALVNAGAAIWSGTGSVQFFASSSFDNTATGSFDIQTDSTFGGLGAVLTNEGTLEKSAGSGSATFNGDLTTTGILEAVSGTWILGGEVENHGEVDVAGGTTLQVNGFFAQVEGTINVGGTLTLNGSGILLDLEGGILAGSGIINASVVNAGVIAPGSDGSAGVLTINGSLTQTSSGVVSINLGGTSAGTDYSQLLVNGAVSLDGTLQVQLINGYNPALSDGFQVLTWTSRSGDFAAQSFPTLGDGLTLAENLESNDLRLEIRSA